MKNRRDVLQAATAIGLGGVFAPAMRAPLASVLTALAASEATGAAQAATGFRLTAAPFNEVTLEDRFWKPRLATQADVLVPFAFEKVAPSIENLRRTAAFLAGDKSKLPTAERYIASDLYKIMEGAAYLLAERRDPKLEAQMDSIVEIIAGAQQEDGYLYEAHVTGVSKNHEHFTGGGMGDKPYSWVIHSHELYNMGHMYEGAIAYYRATGKTKWLRVAEKNARHVNRVFFVGDPNYNGGKPVNQAPGHQEIELALVKLYAATGERLYLDMAQRFLDIRGVTYKTRGEGVMSPTYAQQHAPVAQQEQAVGHAVRAAYMYSAMADVGAMTSRHQYDRALNSIWSNIVDTRMHITGGLGAVHGIEGFGAEYELPNKEAYNETCAAVGNVFFNTRMFLLTGDARYMDVAEVSLFNNALAGVNLAGNRFFYVNPLEADGKTKFNQGQAGRSPWFGTACCPSNLARLIPQVPGLMYANDADTLYVTLYGSSRTRVGLKGGAVGVRQEADYPFDGRISMILSPDRARRFTLKLRIPTWARTGRFMPGELYDYVGGPGDEAWRVQVNGRAVDAPVQAGFATIDRTWKPGDRVSLDLPMPVRLNTASSKVKANRGRVAVTRGPLVYCAEGVDNCGTVQASVLNSTPGLNTAEVARITDGPLAGIMQVDFPARRDGKGAARLTMIPYYAWNNRGDGSMIVWLRSGFAAA